MAIVELKKLTICGLLAEKTDILMKLQEIGGCHLISLNKQLQTTEEGGSQKNTEKALEALKYLTQCANKRHQVHLSEEFDLDEIVQKILKVQADIRTLADERDFLINRIEEIKPWGEFNLSADEDFGGIKCWFYIIPKRLMKNLHHQHVYQIVHEDNINCYVVILSEQEPAENSVPVPRTHTGVVPLSGLHKQLQTVQLQLEDKQAERASLTRWISLIALSLTEYDEKMALQMACQLTLDKQELFVMQAWIAATDMTKFQAFANQQGLALMLEDVRVEDKPPTLLQNSTLISGGEDVIKFYQTPAYNGWDPSAVVFFSFAFFFAMILSDAGYAAVFAFLLAMKWSKLGGSEQGQRFRMLAAVTFAFSIIWGVLTGGYFGFTPPAESIPALFKIMDLNDFDSMMKLSITVGVVHIVMANLIKAYQLKKHTTAFAALGWVAMVIGGYLLWLELGGAYLCYALLIIGGGLILLFSSERKHTQPMDYVWHFLDGLQSMTGVTKIFGDILSYMRLFALGLASASLALTFNQLADQVYTSVTGLGLLLSILILLIGHSLNLVICLMSGVVHGLRLNFIEFYSWSVSDEGYAFKEFSKQRK